jgi:hypothetical protein
MRTGIAATTISAIALSGCQGRQYAMDEYNKVPVQSFVVEPADGKPRFTSDGKGGQIDRARTYRIFDKPAEFKLMITPSLGEAAGSGFLRGLTFGAADMGEPVVAYRDAAEKYLASTGRSCSARDIVLIVRPQYEVRYECGGSTPVAEE